MKQTKKLFLLDVDESTVEFLFLLYLKMESVVSYLSNEMSSQWKFRKNVSRAQSIWTSNIQLIWLFLINAINFWSDNDDKICIEL